MISQGMISSYYTITRSPTFSSKNAHSRNLPALYTCVLEEFYSISDLYLK
jgi:hypothetical protein